MKKLQSLNNSLFNDQVVKVDQLGHIVGGGDEFFTANPGNGSLTQDTSTKTSAGSSSHSDTDGDKD